jgi:hypothetical protein
MYGSMSRNRAAGNLKGENVALLDSTGSFDRIAAKDVW